ncbi:MAG TPA: HEPN domain-containing protein [Solirubrobacterales bacterium]
MLEVHQFKGVWSLPSSEAEGLPGTLTVERGKADLELIGDFGHQMLSESPREKSYSLDPADQPRVLGSSTDGKDITLEKVSSRNYQVSIPGLPVAHYTAQAILVGKHFAEGDPILFDEIAIRASDLNAWTRVSGFEVHHEFEKLDGTEALAFTGFAVDYKAPEDIEIELARGERAFIRYGAKSEGLIGRTDHVAVTQEAAIHFRFAKKAGLDQVFRRVSEVRNFLSLAVGRPVSVLAVTGYLDDYAESNGSRRPIDLMWQVPHNPNPPERGRRFHEMLFSLPEASPDISSVMKRWLARQARLKPVFNLFFGVLYHPDLYLEVRFLTFAQAIETYDYRRRRKPGQKTLAERMREVLHLCRTVTKRIIGPEEKEVEAFIKLFKDSRNYYTHYNPKLEAKAAGGVRLYLLTIQLRAIIEMSLLRELGFPARSIDAILERGRRYEEIEHFKAMAAEEVNADS